MTASDATRPDPTRDLPHEMAAAADELARLVEQALQLPEPASSWWHRPGITPRAERWLEVVSSLVVGVAAVAWTWSIVEAREDALARQRGAAVAAAPVPGARAPGAGPVGASAVTAVTPTTRAVATALTRADAPTAAYVTDAAVRRLAELRGRSGKLEVALQAPGDAAVPAASGLRVLPLVPLSARRGGRLGLYYIGTWPTERTMAGAPARGDYRPPRGLVQVTRENQDTRLSEHLRLRDFLTHDQANVWPKYVVISPKLVDKDELVLADLRARGVRTNGFHVMSGFRTPRYNSAGGDTRGRAGFSRHMYGDANDVWIDADGDGQMDDINRDGRVDIGDARAMCDAVDRVEARYPELVGGCGWYPATSAHGPFVHIDTRGYRARWVGSGNGG